MNQRILIDSVTLIKQHYTPTEIAIINVAINEHYSGFTLEEIINTANEWNLKFMTLEKISTLIHKMIKDGYGVWFDNAVEVSGSEFSFCFTNRFVIEYCKLIDFGKDVVIELVRRP